MEEEMINRDNLTAETTIWAASISVSETQWSEAENEIARLRQETPGIEFNIPDAWAYHNGGYYYREIAIGHPWPGRAFEAMERIAGAIHWIPVR